VRRLAACGGDEMASRRFLVLARWASALFALGGVSACTDDGVSLHVICPIFPEIEDNACVYSPDSEACVLEGVMNLMLTQEYKQSLRVESGLKAREREVPPLGETNGIQVRSAKVEVRLPSGALITFPDPRVAPNPFRVVATGWVPPGEGGVVSLTLLTPGHAAGLREVPGGLPAQIVLGVEIEGKTSGDVTVKAGEYAWPVRLLDGVARCSQIDYCPNQKGQDGFASACD
jgi:hypothetical protein